LAEPWKKRVFVDDDEQLKRPRYFDGKVLSANDFTTEQEYHRAKQRRHNRYLHGWGVVSGFSVSVRDDSVIVESGVAIDCAGNEIFQKSHTMNALLNGPSRLYVVVEYYESTVDPVPQPLDYDCASEQGQAYAWIEEASRVYIIDVDPTLDHDEVGPGSCGCGRQHPMAIACLVKEPKAWSVIPYGRR